MLINKDNSGAASGSWHSASKEQSLDSINPATGQCIGRIHACLEKDYEMVVQKAREAFLAWRQVPAPKRGEAVRHMANALRDAKPALARLITEEMGKPLQESLGEVQEMIDIADFAVGQSRMLYGLTMPSERPQHRLYEQWHPYGVVGVITAFNFPVAVWSWNAFIAAICGNTVIWKPSSKVPLCAVAVHNICCQVLEQQQLPAVFHYFVPADHRLAERFVNDERIPLIAFTGSTKTGRQISQQVAKRLGRTILELGGNNAVIVDETADIAMALRAVVFSAVGTAGQRCTSVRRLFVHERLFVEFLARLVSAYQQLAIGDPLDKRHHLGPLVDQSAVVLYQRVLKQLSAQGATIAVGGKVLGGFYVEPTIVTDVANHWDWVQQETFAPILYAMPFQDFAEVLTEHNAVSQGLSSSLFTRNLLHAEYFLSHWGSDCGIANVNVGTSGAEIGAAFGGEKATGGGREAGSDAWKAYMRRQTVTVNWGDSLPLAQGIQFGDEPF